MKKIPYMCYQPNMVDHFHKLPFSYFVKQGISLKKRLTFLKNVHSWPFGKNFFRLVQICVHLSMVIDPKIEITTREESNLDLWH